MNLTIETTTMKHSILRRLAGVMAGCLLVLAGQAGATPRDDTEIYFNTAEPSKNSRPNALFILDTSISMERAVKREAGAKSRIATLREAMSTLLDGISNVNVGFMRFNGLVGSSVLFPVTDIDSDVSQVPGETAVYTALITSGENDARENRNDDKVTLDDERIEDVFATPKTSFETVTKTYTVDDGTEDASESVSTGKSTITGQTLDLSADSDIGLLFDNEAGANKTAMRIPPNALIEEAYLEFEIDDATKKAAAKFAIRGILRNKVIAITPAFNDDELDLIRDRVVPDFYDSAYNLSARQHDTASVSWTLAAKTGEETEKQAGYDVKSPDIKTLVQDMVSQGCTTPVTATTGAAAFSDAGCVWTGDKLGFRLFRTEGERLFESRDKTGGSPPRLTVKYKQLATEGKQALTGLRFEGVRIPRGATVTSASLIFTPAADEKRPIKWKIQAEKAGDSAAFTATDGDLSERTKTGASATWTLPDWHEEKAVESVDLTKVVKEVTDQTGWCGGNALSFLISRDGDEDDLAYKRRFFGFEASPDRAVRFKYSYKFDGRGDCNNASVSKRNAARTDDAEQRTAGGRGDWNDSTLNLGTNWVGLRFPGVDVPPGATIERAYLELYARANRSTATTYTIRGENTGNAAAYSRARRDITGRSYLTQTVSWRPGRWSTGQVYRSADIKTLVEQQVKHTGWRAGNALAFVINKGGRGRQVASYDRRVGGVRGIQAPRLVIEYFTTDKDKKTFKTVRERLEEIIDDTHSFGSTPIQHTLFEAANYWRGGALKYGLKRNDQDIVLRFLGKPRNHDAFESSDIFRQVREFRKYDERVKQTSRISHPGSYCQNDSACGNADTSGGKAFGVFNPKDNPEDCDPAKNPNLLGCISQEIKTSGTLNYISPFSSALECQRNFQVLLTDGLPNQGSADGVTDIETLIGKSCAADSSVNRKCLPDLARFLADTDQSSLDGDQKIRTYTIGFALQGTDDAEAELLKGALPTLRKIATEGRGRFYSADTGDALLAAFEDILASESDSATLAASPVAANAFNRLFSRDNIYFGSFAPAPGRAGYQSKRWAGNLKKYRICISAAGPDGDPATTADNCTLGEILDASGNNAIGANGQFTASARNLWNNSGEEDGNDVKQGGAGAGITDYTGRKLYTDIGGATAATASTGAALSGSTGFEITSANWKDDNLSTVRDAVCGKTIGPDGTEIPAPITAGSDCEQLMEWTLGRDVDDEDKDDITTDTRFVFSDVLHSSPAAVTYDQDSSGDFIDRILIGTNAGGLHFIDGKDGKEQWAFMPNALLARQGEFRANAALKLETGERHGYGLDATPVLRIEDIDNDGRIETADGDKVHVYMAMRRGGNSIYALDISDRAAAPKFLWRIDGEDNSSASGGIARGNFSRMGQTFSEPVLARINTSDGRKTVLIFGGGYDTSLDNDKPAKADGTKQPGRNFGLEAGKPNQGNAIYVVDADSGDLIFWIGHASDTGQGISTGSGADIEVPKMFYSIASNVNVFDSDGDGADDRLYVGDTAGNVWRVDLGADIDPGATSPEGSTVVGHFASLSTAGTLADERRIFYRPAVVQVRDTRFSNAERGEYDYVVVATGNRANPLATGTDDRLYALRDAQTGPMAGSSGLATGYPKTLPAAAGGAGGTSTRPLNNTDLVKINPNLTTGLTGTATEKSAEGWYLDLKSAGGRTGTSVASGEKALAPPLVLSGNILFSTYLPVDPTDPCAVSVGNGRAYNLGILSGRAGLNWDGSDPSDAKTTADAVFELKSGGIPPQVVPVYTTEGIKYLVGKESPPGITQNAAVKTYWYLERE